MTDGTFTDRQCRQSASTQKQLSDSSCGLCTRDRAYARGEGTDLPSGVDSLYSGSFRVSAKPSLQSHQSGGFETVKGICTTGDLEGRAWCVGIAARTRSVLGADVSEHVR